MVQLIEIMEAFKEFDDASKRFIGQCYYEENLKNGKDFKGLCQAQTDNAFNGAVQE